jgi:hypothetical protein
MGNVTERGHMSTLVPKSTEELITGGRKNGRVLVRSWLKWYKKEYGRIYVT